MISTSKIHDVAKESSTRSLTICIATYQRPLWLFHNLSSLVSQIEANHFSNEVEICIRNDEPLQDVLITKMVRYFKKSYIHCTSNSQKLGLAKNLTVALQSSRAAYTLLLSDDDFLTPDALEILIPILKKDIADLLYLNYEPVDTTVSASMISIQRITSMVAKPFSIPHTMYFNSLSTFLSHFFSLGFFQTRLLLSQQSVFIVRTAIIQNNIDQYFSSNQSNWNSLQYPHSTYLWHSMPDRIAIISARVVHITSNNHGWNSSPLKANITVRTSFNAVLMSILTTYGMYSRKIPLYVYTSIFYSYLVYLLLRISSLLRKM